MLTFREYSSLVNILDVLGGDPVGSGDLTEGFDAGVFFTKASELFNKSIRCIFRKTTLLLSLVGIPM